MTTVDPSLNRTLKAVTRNIHVLQADNELTTEGFARATGLAPSTVRRARRAYSERRSYNPTLRTLLKVGSATGLSLDQISGGYITRIK